MIASTAFHSHGVSKIQIRERRWWIRVSISGNGIAYRLVGDDVLADGEAHAGTEAERGRDGAGDDAVAAHDPRSHVAQSRSHFLGLSLTFSGAKLVSSATALVYRLFSELD